MCEKLRKEEAMKRIFDLLKKQSPSRIIALGFGAGIHFFEPFYEIGRAHV